MEVNQKVSRWNKFKSEDGKVEVASKEATPSPTTQRRASKVQKQTVAPAVSSQPLTAVKIVKHPHAVLPEYKTSGAAGSDICANIMYPKWLAPGQTELIDTGLTIAYIPEGYELQVRSRSGLALKGVFVLNAPGTIDSDYRGSVGVVLANFGSDKFEITRGMRIAQLVLSKVERASYEVVTAAEVEETQRAEGAFGSTGV